MTTESTLRIFLGSAGSIYLILGTLHLVYTFFSTKFEPRNSDVLPAMQATSPKLTSRTTMWNAWVGFNASHSTGAMFFGFLLLFAALANLRLYAGSQIIQAVTFSNSIFYLWLGRTYWFRIPYTGILLSTILQFASLVLIYRFDMHR